MELISKGRRERWWGREIIGNLMACILKIWCSTSTIYLRTSTYTNLNKCKAKYVQAHHIQIAKNESWTQLEKKIT